MSKPIDEIPIELIEKWLDIGAVTEVRQNVRTQMTPVSSSNLAAVGYDETNKWLEVAFLDGSVYRYYRVEEEVYTELMEADSHGTYFYWNIRDVYDFDRIAG